MIMIVLATSVSALSFGTSIKNSSINLARGGTGTFRIMFFTRDSGTVRFSLSLEESPKGFTIDCPEMIELNSDSGDNYILIDNEYVRTETLEIRVSVPVDAEPGEYNILLKASSVSQENVQSPIGVNAEKTFLLKVNVMGNVAESGPSEISDGPEANIVEGAITEDRDIKSIEESKEVSSPVSGMMTFDDSYLWILLVFLIIAISYLIYRKI